MRHLLLVLKGFAIYPVGQATLNHFIKSVGGYGGVSLTPGYSGGSGCVVLRHVLDSGLSGPAKLFSFHSSGFIATEI